MRLTLFLPLAALLAVLALGGGAYALSLRGQVSDERESGTSAAAEARKAQSSIDSLNQGLKGRFDVPR